jgi:hypothetical protein
MARREQETSKKSGSSWPNRCAATTGTMTATATRGSETSGRKAHRANAATGTAAKNEVDRPSAAVIAAGLRIGAYAIRTAMPG